MTLGASTIAVPTRGTPAALERIAANIAANVGASNVLVVLNGTETSELKRSEAIARDSGMRTCRCPGGGVSRARNLALETGDTACVIFVDDDVVVSLDAVTRLADAILKGKADVVTARVLPVTTSIPHFDAIFAAYLGFDRGTERRTWSLPARLSPFAVWDVGVGALFAVDRSSVLQHRLARFDERLSNGRFCGGTEDVDFFMRALHSGLTLAYEPDIVAHHLFPGEWASMRKKCRQYALTDGAFYAKWGSEASLVDVLNEIRGWVRRLQTHTALVRADRPAIPLRSLAAEPLYKLVGAAAWLVVLAHRSETSA